MSALGEWHERNLDAALAYAALGWKIFPVHGIREDGSCSCGNRSCNAPGKRPVHDGWPTIATSDADQIRRWFGGERIYNIGVYLEGSGLIVIDVDGPSALAKFKELFGDATSPLVARTGRGEDGYHLYFARGDIDAGKVSAHGIEFRTGEHLVVLPPGRHLSGREYGWAKGDPIEEAASLPQPPRPIVEWAIDVKGGKEKENDEKTAEKWAPRVRIREGEGGGRRNHLVPWAGSFVAKGVDDEALLGYLLGALSDHYHDPPLPSDEIETLAKDAVKRWDSWPDLQPLAPVPSAPGFPVEALPEWLRAYCGAWAAASQTPVDASAVLVLGVLATIAQGRLSVRVLPDWVEPAMLHVMLVMESGMKKSPTFKAVFSPIEAAEIMLAEQHRAAHERALAELEIAEKRVEAAKRKAASAEGDQRHAAEAEYHSTVEARRSAEKLVKETTPPRFSSDNATPEAIDVMLERHSRFTIASAEGDWWSMIAGRYSKEGGLQSDPLTKGWSGERMTVDRKGAPPIIIPEARLSMVVANQRHVLQEIEKTPGARERGILARILKSAPPTMRGYRNVVDPPSVPPEVRFEYQGRMGALLAELVDRDPVEVALSPEAAAAFTRLRQRHEAESRPAGRVHDLAGWAEKWPGQVARIALLLHLADTHPDDLESTVGRGISAAALESAITIGDYFTEQEIALTVEMAEPETLKGARVLLDWIRSEGEAIVEVRKAQVKKSGTVALNKAEKVRAALAYLQEHGYVREEEKPPRGKLAPRWAVNPAVFDLDNLDNPPPAPPVVDVVEVAEGDREEAA
jgi:replicative DNA helicase